MYYGSHRVHDPCRIATQATFLSSRRLRVYLCSFILSKSSFKAVLLCLTMRYDPLESLERLELIVCADCSCRDDSTQRTHRTQNGHTGQRIKFELALTIDPFEAFPTF